MKKTNEKRYFKNNYAEQTMLIKFSTDFNNPTKPKKEKFYSWDDWSKRIFSGYENIARVWHYFSGSSIVLMNKQTFNAVNELCQMITFTDFNMTRKNYYWIDAIFRFYDRFIYYLFKPHNFEFLFCILSRKLHGFTSA